MTDEQTLNLRPPVWALFAAVAIGGLFYLGGKALEKEYADSNDVIVVTGDSRVFAAPDIAQLTFGVQTGPKPTAKAAIDKIDTSMKAIIAAVKNLKVEDKDVSTQQFYMNPVYDWTSGQQRLLGYDANQMIMVKVRDLDTVGEILQAVTAAGANQADGITFGIDDPEALQAQARGEAIKEARERAEQMAQQLGVELGDLKSFSEGFGGGISPMPYYDRAMGMGGGGGESLAIPQGQQEVNVTVTLTYEID